MSEHSPRLDLPYLQPSQAQKHVTVNEAFERLDALTQLVVQAFDALTPPPVPQAGQIWALGETPTDAWSGQGNHLAIATQGGGWLFVLPETGWRAYGVAEDDLRIYGASGWVGGAATSTSELGINTSASPTNRLSVASAATLLTHDGAGHQVKVNKAGLSDTASLLFQTNWAGHAEMGLAGGNDFTIKVSPDGSNWVSAFALDAGTGTASGAAVQAGPLDASDGRLLVNGAYGLGGVADIPAGALDSANLTGFYGGYGGLHGSASVNDNPFPNAATPFAMQVLRLPDDPDAWVQMAAQMDAGHPHLRVRGRTGGGVLPGSWTDIVTQDRVVAPVAEGGVVERSDGPSGTVIRYADGTQICTIKRLALSYRQPSHCRELWAFPAAFSETDSLTVMATHITPNDVDDPMAVADSATPISVRLVGPFVGELSQTSVRVCVAREGTVHFAAGDQVFVSLTATGRWR